MQRALIPSDRSFALFFPFPPRTRTVYRRASNGASLPSPFVHAFSVRFPRINKIPLYGDSARLRRYNKSAG